MIPPGGGTGHTNYLYSTEVWDQSRRGYTIFTTFSGVHPDAPGAPRCTPAVAVRLSVKRIRKWVTTRGPIRVTSSGRVSSGPVGERTLWDRIFWVGGVEMVVGGQLGWG